jgi:hypothetical protein
MSAPTSPTTDRTAYREAVATIAAKAHDKLPESSGRIDSAVKLVLAGDVALLADGTARVASRSNGAVQYHLANGVCDCRDYAKAPGHLCSHRLAYGIARRAQELTPPQEEEGVQDEPVAEPTLGIHPRWLVRIQGKPYVLYAGLLAMAHERGLQALTVRWTYNDAEVSLAEATAVFPFGTYTEAGDSSPANVGKKVALHWRRMALVRAKSRCLRDALNVAELCALEELGSEVTDD